MSQTVYFEDGITKNLKEIFDNHGIKNVFLVTGKKSFSECGAEAHINKIKNIVFTRFSDFEVNPKIEDISKGLRLFRQSKADSILAIGGGSVLDTAKLIKFFSGRNISEVTVSDIENSADGTAGNNFPLIAVPTTAGSGSEATSFAVVYAGKIKYSVAHKTILPDIVIIDPLLTSSLPPFTTAVTGMDAFCHAVEAYWSVNSTDESKEYSGKAARDIFNTLPAAVSGPTPQSRHIMSNAAYLAGKAINIAKTTAAHAVSYSLTSYFSVPHGMAVSIILPELFLRNYNVTENDCGDPRGASYVKSAIAEIQTLLGGKSPEDTKRLLEDFIGKIGLSHDLASFGITVDDIETILNNVNIERLNNNPAKLNRKILSDMFLSKLQTNSIV